MLRRLTPYLLVLALGIVACDRSPGDPLDARADLALLLSDDPLGNQPAPHTLQGLLHSAVHRVYTSHGPGAARAAVAELQRLQDDARRAVAAGDMESAATRLNAVHREELDVVLRVFGGDIVRRVMDGVELDAARLARGVADAAVAGRLVFRADSLLEQAAVLLASARAAAADGRHVAALDAATRAAGHVGEVRAELADARRIPALAELFDLAVVHMRNRSGEGDPVVMADPRLAAISAARAAVLAGDRDAAQDAARAARAGQVGLVMEAFGAEAVHALLDAVDAGIAEARPALGMATARGRQVYRLERMVAAARDMNTQARAALESGDPAAALDLASHAAGLVNAARLALTIH